MLSPSEDYFIRLLRSSLWGCPPVPPPSVIDWERVACLAVEQTVTGLLADALSALPHSLRPPKSLYFSLIAQTSELERENARMNRFVSELTSRLWSKGCHALLLKGQGVGRYWPSPLHRHPGDVDLLLWDAEEYAMARRLLRLVSDVPESSAPGRQHCSYRVGGFTVELHGRFRFFICRRCHLGLPAWADERLGVECSVVTDPSPGGSRSAMPFPVPPPQFDVVFVFAHMLHHFMTGGVGLRQVLDAMLLTRSSVDFLDLATLRLDLEGLGLLPFWRVFASLCVDWLGCPRSSLPFYEAGHSRRGLLMLESILQTGNFGALQKTSQLGPGSNRWLKKAVTACGQLPVYWRAGRLFPSASAWCFWQYARGSLSGL